MSILKYSVDSNVSPEQAEIIEMKLRRQINGLRLGAEAAGTLFELRSASLPGGRVVVKIEPLSGPVLVDAGTLLELVAPITNSQQISAPLSTAMPLDNVVAEVQQEVGSYVSRISISSPDDLPALERAESRLAELVGIPKDEIIADVIGRLRGREWLTEWSLRHYGDVISGTGVVQQSTPFILLAGDPGTGKSVLVHHISPIVAHRLGCPVLFVQLNARLRGTGIQGRAATEVVNVFDSISNIAGKNSLPTMIFLDEAEAVAGSRGAGDDSSGAQENVAVVDALIVALDGVFARSDVRMTLFTATNLLDRIDAAVSRRATIYRFERPSFNDRRLILQHALEGSVGSGVLDKVNRALERSGQTLTAADVLNQVVGRAIREAAHEDRPIDPGYLFILAQSAVATSPVGFA